MKEIPILFSTPMVQAILQDRKTETRRIVKNAIGLDHNWKVNPIQETHVDGIQRFEIRCGTQYALPWFKCPYGQPGDLLFVRETFAKVTHSSYRQSNDVLQMPIDDTFVAVFKAGWERSAPSWKPSIHMPKAAARIWLRNCGVHAERLQDITEAGAIAEGIIEYEDGTYKNYFNKKGLRESDGVECILAKGSYQSLWSQINGPESWDANPWVWVVKFEVLSKTGRPG